MKRIKKFIITLITLAMTLTTLPMVSVSVDASNYENDIVQLMLDLGIYSDTDDMHYENEVITREEMASFLSVFYGLTEESYTEKTVFEDVTEGWSSGHIMAMVSNGCMSGYSDGLFRPLTTVTYEMAVKTLVSMTGYDIIAQRNGGFPHGYFQVAEQLGMLKHIDVLKGTSPITRGVFNRLLYNTLDVPILKQVSFGAENEFKSEKNRTLLTEQLHIYQAKGIVSALPYVELGFNDGAGYGKIKVGNTLYYCDFDAYEYLGRQAEFYYKKESEDLLGKVLHLSAKSDDQNCITVNAEDIVSFSNRVFTYNDGSRTEKISLPVNFMLIFNGKRLTNYEAIHLMPKQGYVRFCDTDSDNVYDKVIVNYEINYRVEKVSESEGMLYITDANGRMPIKLDIDSKKHFCFVMDRGLLFNVRDLQKDDIISIAADKMDLVNGEVLQTSSVFHIQRADNDVNGKVIEIRKDELSIDGAFYKKSVDVDFIGKSVIMGENSTFYLNYLGWVVDFECGKTTTKYGILTAIDVESGLNENIKLRIYSEDDKFLVFESIDGLRIDGVRKKKCDEIKTYLKYSATQFRDTVKMNAEDGVNLPNDVWQVVKFAVTEDGKLNGLDTILVNDTPSENDLTYYKTKPVQSFSWVNNTIGVLTEGNEERYGVTDDVIIFSIDIAPQQDSDYTIFPRAALGGTSEMMFFFDPDEMDLSNMMIRVEEDAGQKISGYETSNVMLYEGTKFAVGDDGIPYECIYGVKLLDGSQVELKPEETFDLSDVVPGDILRWKTNSQGVTTSIQKALIRSDSTLGEYTKDSNEGWEGQFGGQLRLNYGRAEAVNNTHLMIRFDLDTGVFDLEDGGRYLDETVATKGISKWYVFNTRTNKLSESSLSEIKSARKYGTNDADMLVSYYAGWSLKAIVIYR